MAAFIGERHCELIGAKWFFKEYMYTPFTQKENHLGRLFWGLEDVVRYYRAYKMKEGVPVWFKGELLGYEEAYEKKNGGSDAAGIGRTVVCAGEEI